MNGVVRIFKILILMLFIAALWGGCSNTSTNAGGFNLGFVWPAEGKPDFAADKYYSWVVLQEWPEGDQTKARTLGEAGPAQLDITGQAKIELKDLTYGKNRVVRVEIRKSESAQDRPLYFGVSNIFNLEAGKISEVQIAMQLQETPGTGSGGSTNGSFSMDIYSGGAKADRVGSTAVTLRFAIKNGDIVVASNKLGLLEAYLQDPSKVIDGVVSKKISELKIVSDGVYELDDWDLNSGRDESEKKQDGDRIVYAKLLNNMGYQSETQMAKVSLDTAGPVLVSASVSPKNAKGGDNIAVAFTFSEDVSGVTIDDGGLGIDMANNCTIDGGKSYVCIVKVESQAEKLYNIAVGAADVVGNKAVSLTVGNVTIDRTLPEITDQSVSWTDDKPSIKLGDEVFVQVSFSEELADISVRIDGRELICTLESLTYTCSYKTSTADISGIKLITVTMKDKAGNEQALALATQVAFDFEKPQVLTSTVAPAFCLRGANLEVAVSLTEPVVAADIVAEAYKSDDPTKKITLTLAEGTDYQSLRFTHIIGDGDEEGAYQVRLSVLDNAGNDFSSDSGIGETVVDKTAPEVNNLELSIDPAVPLREGVVFTAQFDVSEEIKLGDSLLEIGKLQIKLSDCEKNGNHFICTHAVDKTEGDGTKHIAVAAVDLAGNLTRKPYDIPIIYDTQNPGVMNAVVVPSYAKKDVEVQVSLSFSEEVLPETVQVKTDGIDFIIDSAQTKDNQQFIFKHTVNASDTEGQFAVKAKAVDKAGNLIDWFQVGTVTIDKTAVEISGFTVNTKGKTKLKESDEFTIDFSVSEEIGDSIIQIGTLQIKTGQCAKTGSSYSCSHSVNKDEGDGTKQIVIEIQDKAGNVTRKEDEGGQAISVVYDMTAPILVEKNVSPSGNPGQAPLGSTVTVMFMLSEDVADITFNKDGLDMVETIDGRKYTYQHLVTDTDTEKSYAFTVSFTDIAGNASGTIALGGISLDRTIPSITGYALSSTNVKLGQQYNISFDISEELKEAPQVMVGSKNITAGCVRDFSGLQGDKWVCTHTANSEEGDGVKQITVSMADKAGNTAVTTLKDSQSKYVTIEYDVTAPDIVNPVIAPEKANLDSTIDVRFSFTEDVENVVIDWGGFAGTFTRPADNDGNKRLFIYKHKVIAGDAQGSYPVKVTEAVDKAGNTIIGIISIGTFEIDNTSPELASPAVRINGDALKVLAKENDSIEIKFTVAEEIADKKVRIGLILIPDTNCSFNSGLKEYTCIYTAAKADGEGSKDITVELKDKAGNAGSTFIKTISYDMTSPEIANSVVLPTKVNKSSAGVTVKFSFTEDVLLKSGDVAVAKQDSGSPDLTLTCDLDGSYKKDYTCSYSFGAGDARVADYTVSAGAEDKAGNKAVSLSVGTVSTDREMPYISANDVNPVGVKLNTPFTVSFTVNEDLADSPVVKVGSKQLSTCTESPAHSFTCTHNANSGGDEGEGVKVISVALIDNFGNSSSTDFSKTVNYDTVAPVVLNPTVSPEVANAQTVAIDVRFSFPEDVTAVTCKGTKISGSATAPAVIDFPCIQQGNAKTYKCTYTMSGTWKEGTFGLAVNAKDIAGNYVNSSDEVNGIDISRSAIVDRAMPAILTQSLTQCTGTNCGLTKTKLKAGDTVKAVFTVDETLRDEPIVKIAGANVSKCSGATDYSYCYTVTGNEGDGQKAITVEITDIAGNTSSTEFTSKADLDVTAPTVLNPVVTPQNANAVSTIQVSFSFSETITLANMSVKSADGTITYSCSTGDSKKYNCTHGVTPGDGSGYTIVASGTDTAGNILTNSSLGSFAIDRTSPSISNTALTLWNSDFTQSKTVVKAGDRVRAVFTASKALKQDPSVRIGGQLMTKTAQTALTYTYEYTVQQTDGDGDKTIAMELQDESDNTATATFGSTAAFDVTAPTVLNPVITPLKANGSSTVTTTFSFSEAVVSTNMSVKSADGTITYSCSTGDSKKYTCTHAVAAGDGTGYSIVANGTDTAGNSLSSSSLGSFTIDRVAPTLSATSVSLYASNGTTPKTVVKKDDVVKAVFTASETLAQNPTVRIGGQPMSFVSKSGLIYTYTYTVQQTDGDGDKQVAVDITDESGNASTVTLAQTAAFDVTAPTVLNPVITPLKANASSTVTATFSFSETIAIGNMSVKSADGTITYSCGTTDSKLYTCTHAVAAGDGTGYTIVANGTDTAGNSLSTSTLGSFTIDRVAPTLSATSVSLYASNGTTPKTVVKKDDVVKAIFTASETLAQNPTVRIGGQPMSFVSKSGLIYTYTYTVQQTDGDGDKQVAVDITDESGNASTVTLAQTAAFDVTAPTVLNPVITPLKANASSTVTATFSFSETIAIGNMSVKSADGTITYSCSTGDSKKYTCTHAVAAGDGAGYSIVASGTDTAGNILTNSSLGSFAIDRVSPTISGTALTLWNPSFTQSKTVVKAGDRVRAVFTASKALKQDPAVRIGGQPMTKTAQTSLTYTYEYTVQQTDGDGDKTIAMELQDESDNTATATFGSTAAFDVTAPTVLNPVITPLKANGSSTVTTTFSFSETIAIGNMSVKSADGTITYSCSTGDSKKYTCTHAVAAGDGAGYTIVASGTDTAGNILTNSSLGSFAIDRVAPALSSSPAPVIRLYLAGGLTLKPNQSTAKVKADEVVTISFTTQDTQMPGADPVVRIGVKSMSKVSQSGNAYVYSYTVAQADGDGDKPIMIDMQDEYANTGSATPGTVSFDVTAPSIVSSIVTPSYSRAGAVVTARFTFSEQVASYSFGGNGLTFTCGTTDSQTYTCLYTVLLGDNENVYNFTATGTDATGNTSGSLTVGSTTIDRTAPAVTYSIPVITTTTTINSVPAVSHYQPNIGISFTVTPATAFTGNPTVTFGGVAMAGLICSGSPLMSCSGTYVVPGIEMEGTKMVDVTVYDQAGNWTSLTTKPIVIYDFSAPNVVSSVVGRTPDFTAARNNNTKTLTYTMKDPYTRAYVQATMHVFADEDLDTAYQPKLYDITGSPVLFTRLNYVSITNDDVYFSKTFDSSFTAGGPYTIGIVWRDKLGNQNSTPAALDWKLAFSTTAPTSPVVSTVDNVIYTRVPWGSKDTSSVKQFAVAIKKTALVSDSAAVFDGSDVETAGQIGRLSFEDKAIQDQNSDTYYRLTLSRADRPVVYITAVNSSGNLSDASGTAGIQAAKIRDVVWVATLGGKVPYSTLENPLVATKSIRNSSSLIPETEFDEATSTQLSQANGQGDNSIWQLTGGQPWIDTEPYEVPATRLGASLVYDSVMRNLVLVGGNYTDMGIVNTRYDTWEYDIQSMTWAKIYIGSMRPEGWSMVFDTNKGVSLLIGLNVIYEYDGTNKQWAQVTPTGVYPTGSGQAVYDSDRNVTIFWGMENYVYEYNSITRVWTRYLPATSSPTTRSSHAMVYDSIRKKVVMFGGYYNLSDLWEYDPATHTWAQITPLSTTNPTGRYDHRMVFEASSGDILMIGNATSINDVWRYKPSTKNWAQVTPTNPPAQERSAFSLVYDPVTYNTYAFGGYYSSGSEVQFNDLWTYSNSDVWKQVYGSSDTIPSKPGGRASAAMAYDSTSKKIVIYGGVNTAYSFQMNDVWDHDLKTQSWTDVTPASGGPGYRYGMQMVFTPAVRFIMTGGMVVFGGSDNYVWRLNRPSNTWVQVTDATYCGTYLCPSARTNHGMVYHTTNRKVLMFGGDQDNYLWEWNPAIGAAEPRWTNLTTLLFCKTNGCPPARGKNALVWDSSNDKLVMFGGITNSNVLKNDLWTWDFATSRWSQITYTCAGPGMVTCPNGGNYTGAYDSLTRSVYLFGGTTSDGDYLNELWRLNLTTNVIYRVSTGNHIPAVRNDHSMVMDSTENKVMLFGGGDHGYSYNDLWQLDTAYYGYPVQLVSVPFSEAGAESGSTMAGVTFNSYAGGTGYSSGCAAASGAAAYIWKNGAWSQIAYNSATPSVGDVLSYTTSDTAVLGDIFIGNNKALDFMFAPYYTNGCYDRPATVGLDYFEAQVKYRLP